ncbi:MAG: hypothetical protein Q7S36_00560 [Candidatus Liptonbacteria bacterium]|nr:hypothetical protein [Candidatus Liptonbacteria bacterium]
MIDVRGNELWRGGQKIGYISDNDIFSNEGKKLGYVSGNAVYNAHDNKKLAYLQGNFVYDPVSGKKIEIEENREHVVGGQLSDVYRAAVRMFLGD